MAYSVGSVTGLLTKTGIGGLASGMDIDSLIEKMTSLNRQRITKQEQSVQKLLWKQDAYRSVSKSLIEFRDKYLSLTSATNFKSTSIFNTIAATVDSNTSAFTATATGEATAGKMYINRIDQLASNTQLTNDGKISKPLEAQMDIPAAFDALHDIENNPGSMRTFLVDLDGQSRLIVMDQDFVNDIRSQSTGDMNEKFQNSLQKLLNLNFNGEASPTAGTERVKANVDSGGKISFDTLSSSKLTIKATGDDAVNKETLEILGFTEGQSNKLDTTKSLADLAASFKGGNLVADANGMFRFGINNTTIEISQDQSLTDLMIKINNSTAGVTLSYSEISDKFTLTAKNSGAGDINMGDIDGNLMATLFDSSTTTQGGNAVLYINGVKVERSTNDFAIDGVRLSLKETLNPEHPVTGPAPASPTSGETISLAPDSSKLFDAVKQFVEDYNGMITFIKGLTKEQTYSDFEPLTDAQKADMSEGQVKSWEDKAKSGILLNDSLTSNLATSIQGALLNTTGINGFGLYSMGIKSAGWAENGKLTLDEDALRAALDKNPDEVRALFTDAANGISPKLDKLIDNAVRTSGVKGTRGSLIEMAGYASTQSDTENSINTQITSYNKNINSLKTQLEKEESRLWSRFSAMESALAKLNQQNSILTQYLGTKS
ncbi:MAG: flagellar filament capping protein FliD [Clostridiales Family XIII bacterium]|jgi:flagellar hook-associated protein 2|nr:flagellar filament capping protein FliD [Clostridiales Family XIII bacterium]